MSKKERFLRGLTIFFYAQVCVAFILFGVRSAMETPLKTGADYRTPQNYPVLAPEPIAAAAEMDGRIYVLFDDTAAVNVYNAKGQFLWSVSVPYHDHNTGARMVLKEGKLYIYQRDQKVYCYNGVDGRFLEFFDWESRSEEFPVELRITQPVNREDIQPGGIYFSGLKVYRGGENGALEPIIVRSPWIKLLYFITPWILGFFGGIALFALERIGPLLVQRKRGEKRKWAPKEPEVLRFYKRAKFTVRLNIAYAAANVIDGVFFHSHYFCIGIMLIMLWFILFSIFSYNRVIDKRWTEEDQIQIRAWEGYMWLSMVVAFFSVVINVVL